MSDRLIAVVAMVLSGMVFDYKEEAEEAKADHAAGTVVRERNEAQFTLNNYTSSIHNIQVISETTEYAKQQNTARSEETQISIKATKQGELRIRAVVPADIADRLLEHAHKIRQGTSGPDSSKSAG